jgi:hypothetical protein
MVMGLAWTAAAAVKGQVKGIQSLLSAVLIDVVVGLSGAIWCFTSRVQGRC